MGLVGISIVNLMKLNIVCLLVAIGLFACLIVSYSNT